MLPPAVHAAAGPPGAGTAFTLEPTLHAVGQARDRVALTCAPLDQETRDDAVLLASELVTNAVVHGAGPVNVWVSVNEDYVSVAVADHGTQPLPPVLRRVGVRLPPGSADRGRGLALLAAVARHWGIEHYRDERGTVAWFQVAPRRDGSGGAPNAVAASDGGG